MTADDRDELLIARAVTGDDAALERLMMRHHERLVTELDRKLPANVRAYVSVDDALQEAYVIVFREITAFQPRHSGAFYAWVMKIAENRLFDAIKAERAAKRGGGKRQTAQAANATSHSAAEWLELLAVNERTPSRSAAEREAVVVVRNALCGLKDDYREALRLRYVEGLPVAETAARMQRSEGAVCLLCHRAMKQLANRLGSSTRFFTAGG